ncbi:MAG: hypothetical protein JWM35_2505 [Verrucomicrobia bacterium]|nr:hypothetical protein [Verrucomicrobiota bacterium]
MNPASPTLRPATPADAGVALSWSPGVEALRRWSGWNTRHPATPESLWEDVATAGYTTFALESAGDGMIGFGQVRFREEKFGHLARIIVSPHHRGKGLGRVLCTALMREAITLNPAIGAYSLYVYDSNSTAISLYLSLGFADAGRHPDFPDVILMIRDVAPVSDWRI